MPLPRTIGMSRAQLAGNPALRYTKKVVALSPIAYWTEAESSGSVMADASGNGRNGAYNNVTLGAVGIGDGRSAASYNGTSSWSDPYSASFAAAFNSQECSIMFWARANSGMLTDGASHQIFSFVTNGSNLISLGKNTSNNQHNAQYVAGGTTKNRLVTTALTTWQCWLFTISKSNDRFIVYLGGVQQGATNTGLGTYSGALASNNCTFGAANHTPAQLWNGDLGPCGIWTRELSAADAVTLATVP